MPAPRGMWRRRSSDSEERVERAYRDAIGSDWMEDGVRKDIKDIVKILARRHTLKDDEQFELHDLLYSTRYEDQVPPEEMKSGY